MLGPEAAGGDAGTAELTFSYVAELVEDQLSIDAIHRLYHGIDADELLAVLAESFDTAEAGAVVPAFATEVVERGALCLVRADGTGVWLTPKADLVADAKKRGARLLGRVRGIQRGRLRSNTERSRWLVHSRAASSRLWRRASV